MHVLLKDLEHSSGNMSWPGPSKSIEPCSESDQNRQRIGHFAFLSLPLEIRYQIYRELLLSDAEWIRPVSSWVARTMLRFPKQFMVSPWPHPVRAEHKHEHKFTSTKLDTAILLVNKQIYAEARPVLLEQNPILLNIRGQPDDAATMDQQSIEIMKLARVLALRVDHYRFGAAWLDVLKARTNLRTIRIRVMNRSEQDLSTFSLYHKESELGALGQLADIRACAVATVECGVGYWLKSRSARLDGDGEDDGEEEKAGFGRFQEWLKKDLSPSMLRKGCMCLKREDGTHIDRVMIGCGGSEAIKKEL